MACSCSASVGPSSSLSCRRSGRRSSPTVTHISEVSPASVLAITAVAAALAIAALWSGEAVAQSAAPLSDTEVSKEVENPVTRRILLPLRYEASFLDGAYKATKDTFEIDQAAVPFRLNDDWALITRTKLPVEAVPARRLSSAGRP